MCEVSLAPLLRQYWSPPPSCAQTPSLGDRSPTAHFASGASLRIEDCVVSNMNSAGIRDDVNGCKIVILDTIVGDNGGGESPWCRPLCRDRRSAGRAQRRRWHFSFAHNRAFDVEHRAQRDGERCSGWHLDAACSFPGPNGRILFHHCAGHALTRCPHSGTATGHLTSSLPLQ